MNKKDGTRINILSVFKFYFGAIPQSFFGRIAHVIRYSGQKANLYGVIKIICFNSPPCRGGVRGGYASVHILAVRKEPHSAKPDELLAYEEIDKNAIIKEVKRFLK